MIEFAGGLVDPAKNTYFLRLHNPQKVRDAIPASVQLDPHLVAVPTTPSNAVLLHRLGIKVPNPIRWKYRWPLSYGRKPFPWQQDTADFCTLNPRCFVFNSAGTGKTISLLWTYDYLRQARAVTEPMLVMCPKSCVRSVWVEEAAITVPHLHTLALVGDGERRLERIEQDADIYVTNHHTLLTEGSPLAKRRWGVIVLDEATVAQDMSTRMWKALMHILEENPQACVYLLTATPCSQSAVQAYGLAKLVVPGRVPFTLTVWRQATQYKIQKRDPATGKPKFTFWTDRPDSTAKVFELLQPAIRVAKQDVMQWLPPITFQNLDVEVEPQTKVIYEQMRKDGLVMLADTTITSVHAASQANKLLQISSGILIGNDGTVRLNIKSRLAVLRECIETSDSKTIVAIPFTEALNAVAEEVAKYRTVAIIDGSVSANQRATIVNAFQNEEHPQVLIGNPKAMGHGLTLTEASTTVWWSPIYSQEVHKQLCERTDRPGQKHSQRVIYLLGTPAERYVAGTLRELGAKQLDLLSMYNAQ